MTHCARRSRTRAGHQTATGPVTPTCLHDRWGRAEATRTALGEALVVRRRTRVRFPPPPPPLTNAPDHWSGAFVISRRTDAVTARRRPPDGPGARERRPSRACG